VGQAPGHGLAHGPVDRVPAGPKPRGHLLPAQPSGPVGQKPRIGRRDGALALRPRNPLDADPATRAEHSAHRVDEEDPNPPERDELEAPLRQPVVARSPPTAAGALGPAVRTGSNSDLELWNITLPQAHLTVDERRLLLNAVQDSLELHPASVPRLDGVVLTTSSQGPSRDAPLLGPLQAHLYPQILSKTRTFNNVPA